jgi:hypothetical protein
MELIATFLGLGFGGMIAGLGLFAALFTLRGK